MSLSLLFERKFDEFFAQPGGAECLWLFVHVPKTAGSSLVNEFAEVLKPRANIHVERIDPTKPFGERLDIAVNNFLELAEQKTFRFASGHILAAHTARLRDAIPRVRCVTMLRHPTKRMVSDYRYQRSDMHPGHENFKRTFATFESFVASGDATNKMARYLVPRSIINAGDVEASIDHVMQNFEFVGLQEMYPLSFKSLMTMIGAPRQTPKEKVRVNTVGAEEDVVISPELEKEIRRLNPLDIAIYNHFAAAYREIRDDLTEYLQRKVG